MGVGEGSFGFGVMIVAVSGQQPLPLARSELLTDTLGCHAGAQRVPGTTDNF